MPKQIGILMTVVGAALLIGSTVSLRYPDVSQWFPAFLLAGGYLAWAGVRKYRAA
jgi:hypothetical protein